MACGVSLPGFKPIVATSSLCSFGQVSEALQLYFLPYKIERTKVQFTLFSSENKEGPV